LAILQVRIHILGYGRVIFDKFSWNVPVSTRKFNKFSWNVPVSTRKFKIWQMANCLLIPYLMTVKLHTFPVGWKEWQY